jgi:hypothetical protein
MEKPALTSALMAVTIAQVQKLIGFPATLEDIPNGPKPIRQAGRRSPIEFRRTLDAKKTKARMAQRNRPRVPSSFFARRSVDRIKVYMSV